MCFVVGFLVFLVIVKWEKTCSVLFKYSAFKNSINIHLIQKILWTLDMNVELHCVLTNSCIKSDEQYSQEHD